MKAGEAWASVPWMGGYSLGFATYYWSFVPTPEQIRSVPGLFVQPNHTWNGWILYGYRADVEPSGFSKPVVPRLPEPVLLSDGSWHHAESLFTPQEVSGSVVGSPILLPVQSYSSLGVLPPTRRVYSEGLLSNLEAVALQERYELYCRRSRAGRPVVADWWRRPQLPLPAGSSDLSLTEAEVLAIQERRARAMLCSTSQLLALGECWCAPIGTPLPCC